MTNLNEMRVEFPALPENEALARLAISAFILPLDPTLEQLADIKTSVSEAVTNAIIHGYAHKKGGTVRLEAALRGDHTLSVDVCDEGVGIADIEKARQPFFSTQVDDERSGMGFTVMESFMDRVDVRSAPGRGTTVHMEKRLTAPQLKQARRA